MAAIHTHASAMYRMFQHVPDRKIALLISFTKFVKSKGDFSRINKEINNEMMIEFEY